MGMHPAIFDQMMIHKSLIKVWILEMISNITLLNHHYQIELGMNMKLDLISFHIHNHIQGALIFPLKGILIFPPKFYIFWIDMIRC